MKVKTENKITQEVINKGVFDITYSELKSNKLGETVQVILQCVVMMLLSYLLCNQFNSSFETELFGHSVANQTKELYVMMVYLYVHTMFTVGVAVIIGVLGKWVIELIKGKPDWYDIMSIVEVKQIKGYTEKGKYIVLDKKHKVKKKLLVEEHKELFLITGKNKSLLVVGKTVSDDISSEYKQGE